MNKKQLGSSLLLLLATIIWGGSFVVLLVGLGSLGPLFFGAIRFFIAGLALLPFVLLRRRRGLSAPRTPAQRKLFWKAGLLCGAALFTLSIFQQTGLRYTTAGKTAFVTTLYVVLVPIFGLLLHKKPGLQVWLAAILAACGLFFLCVSEAFTLNRGDIITLGCAIGCSVHILLLEHYTPQVDGVELCCLQFFSASALSLICALPTETVTFERIYACRYMLLYAGVLASAAGNTLQALGQRNIDAPLASLIMCLESVFAVLAGWIFLNELLSAREWFGCSLMFIAIVLSQLPLNVWRRPLKRRAM